MIIGELTEAQMERLRQANKLKKYGALETWQELFIYQQICGSVKQIKEIAEYGKLKLNKENVTLPLKDYEGIRNTDL